MNQNELDILLNKFYCGETTLDEERLLREALAGDDADKLLLQGLQQMVQETPDVPADLEQSLSDMIDEWEEKESHDKVAPIAPVASSAWRRPAWWAAAASVAVVIAAGWWLMRDNTSTNVEVNGPKIAQTTPAPQAEIQDEETPQEVTTPAPQDNDGKQDTSPSRTHPVQPKRVFPRKDLGKEPLLAQSSSHSLPTNDEQAAVEALMKFSTTLNKGMDQLNHAQDKIDDINNTVSEHINNI